jgi:hypothetical protein
MANLSDKTRKEQVLARLQAHIGEWVDGPDLANEEVGGSEGLKRLRELRMEDGYEIEKRQHPDPTRSVWQYRLVSGGPNAHDRSRPAPASGDRRPDGDRHAPAPLRQPPTVALPKYESMPTRVAFGEAIPCPRCDGKKVSIDPTTNRKGSCTRCNGFGIVPVP